jgi:hypothetical protein
MMKNFGFVFIGVITQKYKKLNNGKRRDEWEVWRMWYIWVVTFLLD